MGFCRVLFVFVDISRKLSANTNMVAGSRLARRLPCRFMKACATRSYRSFPHGAAQILQQAFNEHNIRYPTRSQKKTLANATVCLVSFAPGLI